MLDSFEILTTSGVVLFSKHYVPVSSNIVNALINDVFIEEKVPSGTKTGDDNRASRNPPYRKEKYTLKWTTAKDLGLIFVAAYQSILHLNWVDNLLDVVRGLFIKEFGKELRKQAGQTVQDLALHSTRWSPNLTRLRVNRAPRYQKASLSRR